MTKDITVEFTIPSGWENRIKPISTKPVELARDFNILQSWASGLDREDLIEISNEQSALGLNPNEIPYASMGEA